VNTAADQLRRQFREVHQVLDSRFDGLASDAQLVWWEDITVNGVLAGCAPLALSTWRGRTGLSQLPPIHRQRAHDGWVSRVDIEFHEFRNYARAVYAATDDYLGCLTPLSDRSNTCVLNALLFMLSVRCGLRQ
jgi:hypothetical protein